MEIFYSTRFHRSYKKLSREVQSRLDEKERLIVKDIFDRSLKTHKLHGIYADFYALSVDYKNRLIFEIEDGTIVFYDVGDHDIY